MARRQQAAIQAMPQAANRSASRIQTSSASRTSFRTSDHCWVMRAITNTRQVPPTSSPTSAGSATARARRARIPRRGGGLSAVGVSGADVSGTGASGGASGIGPILTASAPPPGMWRASVNNGCRAGGGMIVPYRVVGQTDTVRPDATDVPSRAPRPASLHRQPQEHQP
jgi:hypothetical protein